MTIECSGGGDIDVEADDTVLEFTGDCQDIEVDGDNNTITGDNAEKADIEGNNNTVTAATIGEIDVDGDSNTVEVEETRSIDVEGDDNTVTYMSGEPVIETEGNNSVSAA
ncbi:hypothetical protein IWX65_000572 [Arthrobacter sp. CAN_A214]|uniref:DUF3060 domain-containing protein n=1 Tax=Arthrobacter sp. CAN_A214 TaxID=2787720 RepID=UPI0018CA51C0